MCTQFILDDTNMPWFVSCTSSCPSPRKDKPKTSESTYMCIYIYTYISLNWIILCTKDWKQTKKPSCHLAQYSLLIMSKGLSMLLQSKFLHDVANQKSLTRWYKVNVYDTIWYHIMQYLNHWIWISQRFRQGPKKMGVKPERRCEQGRNIEQCCDSQCSCLVNTGYRNKRNECCKCRKPIWATVLCCD